MISPFWSHAAEIWLLTALPEWAVEMVTLSLHMGIRASGKEWRVYVIIIIAAIAPTTSTYVTSLPLPSVIFSLSMIFDI